MKPIEKALYKVISEGIGAGYTYPQGEFLPSCFGQGIAAPNPFYGQTPKAVKFDFGDNFELSRWILQTEDRYPVIWLEYPIEESFTLIKQKHHRFDRIKLIFAMNNTAEPSTQIRLQTTRFVLDQITDKFISLLDHGDFRKFIYIDKQTETNLLWRPNYATRNAQDKNAALDIWDAMVLTCDINLIPNCIPNFNL